jgi:hypothetical protein
MQISVKLNAQEDNLCCGLKECGCHFTVTLQDFKRGDGTFDYDQFGRAVMANIRKIVNIDV